MSDNLSEKIRLFDPTKDADTSSKPVDAIVISGSSEFYGYISRIAAIKGVNININIVQTFTSGKKGLQHLIKWHEIWEQSLLASPQKGLKPSPVRGKAAGLIRSTEKPKSQELPFPQLLIFFDDSEEGDFCGTDFIQILHRAGITKNHKIFFILFLGQKATIEFREFAQSIEVSFVYDIDTKLEQLLNYFEAIRSNFIDAKIGCVIEDSYCNKQAGKTYGPYFSITLLQNDGKKKMVSLGLTLDIKPYEFLKEIPIDSNYFKERIERAK